MAEFEEKNGRFLSGNNRPRASLWTPLGLLILWIASLALVLEVYNLVVVKNFQIDFDPSFEILVAVFCFFMTLLGALLLWRGRRAQTAHPVGNAVRYVNMAILACVIIITLVTISGLLVYSSNQTFLEQQSPYVRPAPRPGYSMGEFPTPAPLYPAPTYDPGGKYLAGALIGSIDHLRVGNTRISTSTDNETVNYIQFTIQRLECLVDHNGTPTTFAVDDTIALIMGPLPVSDGHFYANQETGVLIGQVVSEEKMIGTVSLVYQDPQSGQTCDLGTFEFDAFLLEK